MQTLSTFMKQPTGQVMLAFLVAFALIVFQVRDMWNRAPYADEVTYTSLALELYETGTYGDGTFTGTTKKTGPNKEGMFFAPGYPVFLTALMYLSDDYAKSAKCVVKYYRPVDIEKECAPLHLETMVWTQIVLMALGAMLTWLCAYLLTHHKGVAWLALLFTFLDKDYAELAAVAMSENMILPLFSLCMLVTLLTWRRRCFALSTLCGVLFAMLCYVRPSFIYLLYCGVPFLLIVVLCRKAFKDAALVLLMAIVCAACLAPWVIRNGTKIGIYDLSFGLAPFTFVQRAAFNDMSWTEWKTSFIYNIPSFGDNLAEDLFPEDTYKRHNLDNPEGFYGHGNGKMRVETLKISGGWDHHFKYLLDHYLFNDPFKHVMVTFSMVWRGMWVGGKLALIAIPALFIGSFVAMRRRRWEFLLFAVPPIFMLGFHGFTSVNVTRYNFIMLPELGIAFGWALLLIYYKCRKIKRPLPGLEKEVYQ